MSFFMNLFGGGSPSKPDPTEQKKSQSEEQKLDVKAKLDSGIEKSEKQIQTLEKDIKDLETELKSLLIQKRKDKATVILKKVKAKKQILIRVMNQVAFCERQKNLMEVTQGDMDLLDTIKAANLANQKNRDKHDMLAEELLRAKEIETEYKQRRDEIDDLMKDDDEDKDVLEEMMANYEQEVADSMQDAFKIADMNILSGKTTVETSHSHQGRQNNFGIFDRKLAELTS